MNENEEVVVNRREVSQNSEKRYEDSSRQKIDHKDSQIQYENEAAVRNKINVKRTVYSAGKTNAKPAE